jgi:uncharacterized membrane protein YccC
MIENLSFSSTVFRHSLRLTITILIGFIIGKALPFQNAYWIVLTIVIMRQGYGLTKQRTFHRIFGTILGAFIAFGILFLVHDSTIIGGLAIIALLLDFHLLQPLSWCHIHHHLCHLYLRILAPDIDNLIQYRVVDTLVGALLSF